MANLQKVHVLSWARGSNTGDREGFQWDPDLPASQLPTPFFCYVCCCISKEPSEVQITKFIPGFLLSRSLVHFNIWCRKIPNAQVSRYLSSLSPSNLGSAPLSYSLQLRGSRAHSLPLAQVVSDDGLVQALSFVQKLGDILWGALQQVVLN